MARQDGWRWAGALVLLAAAWPAKAGDDKPAPEKLVALGKVGGVVKNTGGSEKRLVLEVTLQYLEVDPQAEAHLLREQQEVLGRQRRILTTRNPVQRQQEMVQLLRDVAAMQQGLQSVFRVKELKKDVELVPADDLKVRTARPPLEYDDKGYPKKYTKDELKELKGDARLPGYAADFDSVQNGQVVVAYLARKQPAAKSGKKDPPADDKPLVTMLLILSEPKK
jgi:hypothetical protein